MRVTRPKKSKTNEPANSTPMEPGQVIGLNAPSRYMPGKKRGIRRPRLHNGYVEEWCPERRAYIYQHRLVMERHLGRWLSRAEVVHHRNRDKVDNRISNLELHASAKDHIQAHVREGGWGWPKGKPKPWQQKPLSTCPICGERFKPGRRDRRDVFTCSQSCGQTLRYKKNVPPHGTMGRYRRGCSCAECRAANTVKGREFRAIRAMKSQ